MARGDILQIVVFATFFGVATAAVGKKGQPVLDVLESTAQVMFKVTGYVMRFAPSVSSLPLPPPSAATV